MRLKLKNIADQVIVITGASSGIGLATARRAAERGARVVVSSRNEAELKKLVRAIEEKGGKAIYVVADVADPVAMERVAEHAIERFGGFDTWVNNAGVSVYGKLTEVDLAEKRRVFDVNFWGVVHGCRAAVKHLRMRGGAIINLGSVASDRVVPLQGIYCASKHALKAYTDALRMELEMDRLPISVTLVKPAAIDTPYLEHAANKMDVLPKHAPPVYAPEIVADTVLHCAEHPRRDVLVGGSGRALSLLAHIAPRLTDRLMERTMDGAQRSEKPPAHRSALFQPPRSEGSVHGSYDGHVARTSVYTMASLHPAATALAVAGFGALMAAGIRRLSA